MFLLFARMYFLRAERLSKGVGLAKRFHQDNAPAVVNKARFIRRRTQMKLTCYHCAPSAACIDDASASVPLIDLDNCIVAKLSPGAWWDG